MSIHDDSCIYEDLRKKQTDFPSYIMKRLMKLEEGAYRAYPFYLREILHFDSMWILMLNSNGINFLKKDNLYKSKATLIRFIKDYLMKNSNFNIHDMEDITKLDNYVTQELQNSHKSLNARRRQMTCLLHDYFSALHVGAWTVCFS